MSSDVPYWRPPTPRSVWSFSWRLMVSKPVSGPRDEVLKGSRITSALAATRELSRCFPGLFLPKAVLFWVRHARASPGIR